MPTPSATAAVVLAAALQLRSEGPAGLDRLLDAFPREVAALRAGSDPGPAGPAVREAIRVVAAQWDGETSGLYWHTDRAAALEAARRTGRPLLALRLLGRLDDELSCANSRFFRTALYADARIAKELHDGWVLLWESERPVPVVTVDMGDGRTLRTTVTGNSVHYLLGPDGAVRDVLPGLYAPGTFLRELVAAREGRAVASLPPSHVPESLRGSLTAAFAAPLTASKIAVERPLVSAALPLVPPGSSPIPEARLAALARAYRDDARLSAGSRALLGRHMAPATTGRVDAVAASFEASLARDTALNEAAMRPAIRAWLDGDPSLRRDLDALNRRVYDALFRTPASDPWLGLKPDVYAGLRETPLSR